MQSARELLQLFKSGGNKEQTQSKPLVDSTTPAHLDLLGYSAIGVMAWRTLDIAAVVTPDDWLGYIVRVATVCSSEGAALIWHSLRNDHADPTRSDDKINPRVSSQENIALWMWRICIGFSVFTTLASIANWAKFVHFESIKEFVYPIAIFGTGILVIVNAVAYMKYKAASPVRQAQREARARQFQLDVDRKIGEDDVAHIREAVAVKQMIVTEKEKLAQLALDLAKREAELDQVFDTTDAKPRLRKEPEFPKEEMLTVSNNHHAEEQLPK